MKDYIKDLDLPNAKKYLENNKHNFLTTTYYLLQ